MPTAATTGKSLSLATIATLLLFTSPSLAVIHLADPQFAPNDPGHDFRGYSPLHDANFNVLGLVDDQGDLVERYEYRPYGERQVYLSPGVNDPDVLAPTQLSRRVETYGWVTQSYGLNEFGHQGLLHDEETGLVYNRARMLHPRLGRFMQRDPLGYVDGFNLYEGQVRRQMNIFSRDSGKRVGDRNGDYSPHPTHRGAWHRGH